MSSHLGKVVALPRGIVFPLADAVWVSTNRVMDTVVKPHQRMLVAGAHSVVERLQ